MTTIDLASLHIVTGGDSFGTHVGDVAGRVVNGALGNGRPSWMQSLSDAGKIDERDGQRTLHKAMQGGTETQRR